MPHNLQDGDNLSRMDGSLVLTGVSRYSVISIVQSLAEFYFISVVPVGRSKTVRLKGMCPFVSH